MPIRKMWLGWQADGLSHVFSDVSLERPSAWFAEAQGESPQFVVEPNVSEPTDQIPGNTSTPYSIPIGGQETGVINTLGDRDWFSVTLTAGQVYIFTLTGSGGAPLSDPYLALYNSSGVEIAFNDDAHNPDDINSVLTFTPTSSGTYYLGAQAFEDGLTGGYTITAAISTPLDSINWMQTMSTTSIDVYFATAGQVFNGETALRNWTPAESAAAMAALNTFSTFLPLTFHEVGSPTGAELVLTLADIGADTLGYFQVGTPYGFFNPAGVGWDATGLQQGGYGFVTLIHELGHGMGLAHPHDTGGGSTIMPGVTGPFNSYGTHGLNQGVFTMMSYNDGWPTGPLPQPSTSGHGWEGTPMALDIGALQQFYGANMSYHTGPDTYTLTDATTMFSCLWDAGGTDTIAYAGANACNIDLRAATLQYETGGAGWVSYVSGFSAGFTIAHNVVIENATGGSGADALIGNSASNMLNGGAGADAMAGGAGDDTYIVDNAADAVSETASAGMDTVQSSVTFTLTANIENLTLTGGAAINGFGNALNNTITGNGAANQLNGFDGADTLDGGAGGDNMFGGNGDDTYIVDNAGDLTTEVSALGGLDTVFSSVTRNLTANIENLTLTGVAAITGAGNALDNIIIGNVGANTLYGFDGNDGLDGGAGADTLFGANGDDTYVVDDANDITVEGSPAGGVDTVESSISRNLNANFENLTLIGAGATIGYGNVLNNVMTGNAAANSLYGFDGADTLNGGAGADNMFGANGDDTYIVDNAGDVTSEVSALGGVDTVMASVTRNLTANLENLVLTGAVAIDGAGNALDNVITGNSAANTLFGLDGADTLDGGLGADTLQGGAGADAYVFSSAIGAGNVDTINGFSVVDDTIKLDNSVFTGLAAGALDANAFHIGATAGDGDDRIVYDSATGTLWFDADGDGAGAAIQFASLAADLALTNSDFIVVGI